MTMMYRSSKFTAQPKGKLVVNLEHAYKLACSGKEYQPYIEFIIGDQRVIVDEKL
jgi:hypothetical protein